MSETKAPKPMSQAEELRSTLDRMEPQFKKALPSQISAEKFLRIVMTAVQITPDLVRADRQSFFAACMKAAQDGLLPDGREAALVIYNTKSGPIVQYLPMVGGILKKVRNSGELASINAQVVYEKDEFDYWLDETGEHVKFRPLLEDDRGKPRMSFALARTKDGAIYFEVMTENQIQAVKEVSRAKGGPWSGPFEDEMRRKTVIRRLAKRLPMSTDLEMVIRRDDDMFDFPKLEAGTLADESKPVKTNRRPNRLAKIVESTTPAPASEPAPEEAT